MERYEKYKDSGVEWIREIPNDWAVTKISSISACITGFAFKSEQFSFDEGVKLVRGDNVTEGNLRWGDKTRLWKDVTPDLEKFYLAENDIVIGMDGSKVGKNYALVQKDELPLLLVQRVARIRSKNASFAKWIEFATSSYDFKYYVNASKTDPAIPHITLKDIYDYKIFLPPSDKIDFIVEILSKKLSELDTLITKKEKLIELLKEERTAIINQAVTKGLDPDVEMKDSGVEWLGEIPAHWEVSKLKYVSLIKYGLGQPPKQKDDGLPIIRATNVFRGKISKENLVFVDPDDVPWNRDPVLKENDIIVVRSGAYTGDSAIITNEFDGAITGYDMVLRALTINPKFVAFCLLSTYLLDNQLFLERLRAAQPHLNAEELGNSFLILPNIDEQDEIVSHIEIEHKRVDDLISKTDQEITLLKEYKTALISEVVTGKVKVI